MAIIIHDVTLQSEGNNPMDRFDFSLFEQPDPVPTGPVEQPHQVDEAAQIELLMPATDPLDPSYDNIRADEGANFDAWWAETIQPYIDNPRLLLEV